ncbi:MAG: PIN domain-containing protein [Anaerolineales bacterium]|nr:PIN domain-containing protein [Anaerolineales bacterium]
MPKILMDTNILVYMVDPRDVERQEKAIALLLRLEERGAGCLSVQCLSEFVNVVLSKRLLTIGEALLQVEKWHSIFPVFPLTTHIVLEAARGVRDHGLAYYDAQIWAAARLNQVPLVFSEDFQDGLTLEGVRFVNPFAEGFEVEEWV